MKLQKAFFISSLFLATILFSQSSDTLSVSSIDSSIANQSTPFWHYFVFAGIALIIGLLAAIPYVGRIITVLFNISVLILIMSSIIALFSKDYNAALNGFLICLSIIFGAGIGFSAVKFIRKT